LEQNHQARVFAVMLRRFGWFVAILLSLYLTISLITGIWLAEGALHPKRRLITAEPQIEAAFVRKFRASFELVAINTANHAQMKAWYVRPSDWNHESVLLLHGVADNRDGMTGYAAMFLKAGYAVLLPDSRAHGESGGSIATYGVLERNDVGQWARWLQERSDGCVDLFGESMGAAIALQAAAVTPGLCAVVVESSFSSFREIAYDRISQTTGLSLVWSKTLARPMLEGALLYTRLRYGMNLADAQPGRALGATNVPVLLIEDDEDHNIPPRHAALLMRSAQGGDAIWHVPGADHGGAISIAATEFQTKVLGWFESHQASVKTNRLSLVTGP
jgi:hypothetical protein